MNLKPPVNQRPCPRLLAGVLAEARSWVLRDCVGFTPSPHLSPSARCLGPLAQCPRHRLPRGPIPSPWALPTLGAGVTPEERAEAQRKPVQCRWCRSLVCTWELGLSPLGIKKVTKAKSSLGQGTGCAASVSPAAPAARGGCGAGSQLHVPSGWAVPRTMLQLPEPGLKAGLALSHLRLPAPPPPHVTRLGSPCPTFCLFQWGHVW